MWTLTVLNCSFSWTCFITTGLLTPGSLVDLLLFLRFLFFIAINFLVFLFLRNHAERFKMQNTLVLVLHWAPLKGVHRLVIGKEGSLLAEGLGLETSSVEVSSIQLDQIPHGFVLRYGLEVLPNMRNKFVHGCELVSAMTKQAANAVLVLATFSSSSNTTIQQGVQQGQIGFITSPRGSFGAQSRHLLDQCAKTTIVSHPVSKLHGSVESADQDLMQPEN
mmetsp:Transcript_21625/g.60007  ORF Transcript_21625/g.60007 Transcript_21625/m.60007 type:complete len:220 (-) Transcript_21625:1794-2453(-)